MFGTFQIVYGLRRFFLGRSVIDRNAPVNTLETYAVALRYIVAELNSFVKRSD